MVGVGGPVGVEGPVGVCGLGEEVRLLSGASSMMVVLIEKAEVWSEGDCVGVGGSSA